MSLLSKIFPKTGTAPAPQDGHRLYKRARWAGHCRGWFFAELPPDYPDKQAREDAQALCARMFSVLGVSGFNPDNLDASFNRLNSFIPGDHRPSFADKFSQMRTGITIFDSREFAR